jgi:hypothetical protein
MTNEHAPKKGMVFPGWYGMGFIGQKKKTMPRQGVPSGTGRLTIEVERSKRSRQQLINLVSV